MIQENSFEDFEKQMSTMENEDLFPNITKFAITRLADIGHSDKKSILEDEEIYTNKIQLNS